MVFYKWIFLTFSNEKKNCDLKVIANLSYINYMQCDVRCFSLRYYTSILNKYIYIFSISTTQNTLF